MKALFTLVAAAALPFAAHAGTVTNPSSVYVNASGANVFLTAGTYKVSVSSGAWDSVSGDCSKSITSWSDAFDMTIGHGSETEYALKNDPTFTSESNSLSSYLSGVLYSNGKADSSKVDTATFTIASGGQNVEFNLPECHPGNGVTLAIDPMVASSAAPEPASIGLMGMVLVGGVIIARRKSKMAKS